MLLRGWEEQRIFACREIPEKSAVLNSPRIYHKVATTVVPGASYKMFVQDAGRYGNLVYSVLAAINMEMPGPASGCAKMLFFRSSTLGRSATCIERRYDSLVEKHLQIVKASRLARADCKARAPARSW